MQANGNPARSSYRELTQEGVESGTNTEATRIGDANPEARHQYPQGD